MCEKIFVVILNWNKPDDTLECLESCKLIQYDNYEILIVDNHSTDNSVQRIRGLFPNIHLVVNPDNYGYAGGNNVGIRYALEHGAEFILLLNNDVTVEPQILKELRREANANPKFGIAAPKVMYYDNRKIINSMGTSMNWLRLRPELGECNKEDKGQFKTTLKKDILVGCALFINRRTIERIGLIDDKFFLLHEESDWCFRNLKSGYENLVVPTAVIYHKASKTLREYALLTHYYSYRNFLYLCKKNASLINKIKTSIGLTYLSLKHFMVYLTGLPNDKRLAEAFFLGIYDYLRKKMGKCEHSF